eukprot:6207100-Pleurochrysis_carterae.AAC.1
MAQAPTEMDLMQCQMNEMVKAALLQMEEAVDDELNRVENMTTWCLLLASESLPEEIKELETDVLGTGVKP